ncbi:MAG: MotA/TolQ/ExbB proton channel family protein [Polyangiaceae bacterium]
MNRQHPEAPEMPSPSPTGPTAEAVATPADSPAPITAGTVSDSAATAPSPAPSPPAQVANTPSDSPAQTAKRALLDALAGNSRRPQGRASSDVAAPRALALAIPLYGLSVLAALAMPEGVRSILLDRGWVCHAILLLSSLALSILFLKALGLRAQRRAFQLDLLPSDEPRITPDNVARFLAHVESRRERLVVRRSFPQGGDGQSFLVERVHRILSHFAAHPDAAEATAVANAEADADAATSASSFSIVKILVWAIPILGFIGTVVGIGDAVGGFSRSLDTAGQLDTIKTALGDVTSGLAVAFDTTLVALVASILVMMPTSWLQKSEDKLLGDIDDHVVTHLLRRLGAAGKQATEKPLTPADIELSIARVLAAPLAGLTRESTRLAEQLAALTAARTEADTALAARIEAFTASQTRAESVLAAQIGAFADSQARAESALAARMDFFTAAQAKAESALAAQIGTFAAASSTLTPAIDRAADRLARAAAVAEALSQAADASAARATAQLEQATSLARHTTETAARTTAQLEQATSLAQRTTETAARTEDQLCRELGASQKLLTLLAAGMGAFPTDSLLSLSRTAAAPSSNGSHAANGGHSTIGSHPQNGTHAVNGALPDLGATAPHGSHAPSGARAVNAAHNGS